MATAVVRSSSTATARRTPRRITSSWGSSTSATAAPSRATPGCTRGSATPKWRAFSTPGALTGQGSPAGSRARNGAGTAEPRAARRSARLTAVIERAQALAALSEDEFDVVVIGGGITGAGVALDAATRGYSVALVERADFASGTSSRSSKLVHGGLRYLQNFDLGLVREALLERQLMVALAPHLVRPLPLVVPAFEGAHPDRLVGVGLNLYDVMSRERLRGRRGKRSRAERPQTSGAAPAEESWSPERHRVISGEEVL